MNLNYIKSRLLGKQTGYSPKIIIEVGINAYSKKESREKAKEISEIVGIKLKKWLEQHPYRIYVEE